MAALLAGCSGYELRGKVVAGATSQVLVVEEHDPRYEAEGLPNVTVAAMIDPEKPSRSIAGRVTTDASGGFAIPVDQTGAGLLMYDVRVTALLERYSPADRTMPLPGAGKRVLILLARGDHRAGAPQQDILEETMELTKPYRDGP